MNIFINTFTTISDNIIWENLSNYIAPDVSIIYIGKDVVPNNTLLSLHKNKQFDKLIILSKSKLNYTYPRLFVNSSITYSTLEHIKKHCLIIVKLSNDYTEMKWIINNLIKLKKLESKLNLQLGLFTDNSNFLGFIEHSICSQYLDDFINSLRCLFIADKSLQYAYIYDTVCEYLDTQFCKNKICDFQNDKCIANRAHLTAHEDMGCCYSFEYCNFFETKFIKNIKLCEHLINKTCSTKCITCKLFTCKYLKEKHIKFDTHKILLLDCFFDKKQHLILNSNFFKTREDILNKLLEENHDFYFWYVLKKRFKA